MNNILTNALKFSHPQSKILIRADRKEDGLRLSVRDFGIGIPPDLLQDLFDITKATSRAGTGGESGTGFGMPLMKRFINSYGGRIEIHSREKTEDHGTEVSDGVQALDMYKIHKPDFVTLGVQMPRMNGTVALKKIMQVDPEAVVIMMTNVAEKQIVVDIIENGAKGYIVKPIQRKTVLEKLRAVRNQWPAEVAKERSSRLS